MMPVIPAVRRTARWITGFGSLVLALVLAVGPALAGPQADLVLVVKSEKRLYLLQNGDVVASFRVAFGRNPNGHKEQQGDERTPEGRYVLDHKNPHSNFYKSIHISYPDAADHARARKKGVDPGGDIMIHGQRNGYERWEWFTQLVNWTDGCIALKNRDMDFVWNAVKVGTPIEIRP
ncbi:MAG: L,D-transpeptidase family protein [Desulfobacterales bacterium]|nr:L,D-transpeptidase family protein [Desulfobacterales bacterium]